jgi:hypothetical protein
MPSGNSTARALNWSGRGKMGAPVHRDQAVSAADARKEFGEIGAKLQDASSLPLIGDELQLAREFAEYATKATVNQSAILTSVAIMMREADED